MLTFLVLFVSNIVAFAAGAFTHRYLSQKVIAAAQAVEKVAQ